MLLPRGQLAENVLHFVRVLRTAGLPVGPAKVIDAIAAVEAVGVANRTDFREALAAVLVSRQEHLPLFEQAFDLFWRNPKLLEKVVAALLPRVYGRTGEEPQPPDLPARLAQAMLPPKAPPARPDEEDEVELDAAYTFSAREVLQKKDFATMTTDELAQVKAMLARMKLPLPERPQRRTRPSPSGTRVDLRATLRRMTGAAGAVAPLAYRARVRRPPPLVVLCDISGSMDRYARMLLHFVHAITNDRHRVQTLVFGTRLTNITRHLEAPRRRRRAREGRGVGRRLGRRHAHRRVPRRVQPPLVAARAGPERGRAADQRRPRRRRRGGARVRGRAAREVRARASSGSTRCLRYAGFEARPAGIRAILPVRRRVPAGAQRGVAASDLRCARFDARTQHATAARGGRGGVALLA